MAMPDQVKEILGKVESQGARWLLVAVGVVILIRLRLILFAAALPVMAYWHYSNQAEAEDTPDGGEAEADGGAAAGRAVPETKMDGGDDDLQDDLGDLGDLGGGSLGAKPSAAPAAATTTPKGPAWGADEDEDDPFLSDLRPSAGASKKADGGADPYDSSFWGGDGPKPAAAEKPAGATKAPLRFDDDDDDFGFLPTSGTGGGAASKPSPSSGLGGGAGASSGLGGGGGLDDFDFLGGGGNDMDFLGSLGGGMGGGFGGGFGGGDDDFMGGGMGKGKGKGKGKKNDGKGKDPMAPREPDPKQIFVANVGDLGEDELRSFFEEVGDVDRLKVLRNPDGGSKGVCFVTFGSVEQAQKALTLHGSSLDGRNLVVRLAHGGNKGEKGEKGGGKDRPPRDRDFDGPLDLGGGARFGGLGGGDRGKGGFGDRPPKGSGKGPRRNERNEMDELLEDFLADQDGPLRAGDFDFSARRFLSELRSRDRADDTERFKEALDMVLKYTQSKDRSSVRKWPAYVFTLLTKFDPQLSEEMRERDAERKREKGGGGFGDRGGGGGFRGGDRDRDRFDD